jgi:peptidoglycan hydrolase-like protein with peptidoglycan-binding domain
MRKITPATALLLAACTQLPESAATQQGPASQVADQLAGAAKEVTADGSIAAVRRDLKALDYNTGKADDLADPAFTRAILAFQHDQGLIEDGRITPSLLERLNAVRSLLLKAPEKRDAIYVYSDGVTRKASLELLMPPPKGLAADAPANFLTPLRPGSEGSYRVVAHAKGAPALTVTCHAGRLTSADTALGVRELMTVDCAGRDAPKALSWRAFFSPELNAVVRLDSGTKVVELIALRPVTAAWPAAARTGLEWALTHQLDTRGGAPAEWSSTGVAAHFQIRTGAPVSGQQAGLSRKYAALSCRRFEMSEAGLAFPGIACRDKAGWFLPGPDARLASPANALAEGKPVMRGTGAAPLP